MTKYVRDRGGFKEEFQISPIQKYMPFRDRCGVLMHEQQVIKLIPKTRKLVLLVWLKCIFIM